MKLREFINYGGRTCNRAVMLARVNSVGNNYKLTQLAGLYWDLLVQTRYLKEVTYLNYVKKVSYTEIEETTGVQGIRTVIYRDKQRLKKDIGVDIYEYIESGSYDNKEIDSYMTVLESLMEQQEPRDKADLLHYMNINFDDFVYNRQLDMGDTDFVKLVDRLSILSRKYTEMVVREMDSPEIMGYIKYLLGTDDRYLNKHDKERKTALIQAWWLNDIE